MQLSAAERGVIETRVANEAPSQAVAYILWLVLGLLSAHRFYLGRPLSALIQIASYFVLIGFLWLLIDGFLIPGMIRQRQEKIRTALTDSARRMADLDRPVGTRA